jgi:hypothetical protein
MGCQGGVRWGVREGSHWGGVSRGAPPRRQQEEERVVSMAISRGDGAFQVEAEARVEDGIEEHHRHRGDEGVVVLMG